MQDPKDDQSDPMDLEDYRTLLLAILNQAAQDYVRLQHPARRTKKEFKKAFESAVDMILDDSYELSLIKDEDDKNMTLVKILREVVPSARYKVADLRESLVKESVKYWNDTHLNTLEIPDHLTIDGHVYRVFRGKPRIDFTEQIVYLESLEQTSVNQELFLNSVVELMIHHSKAEHPKDIQAILFRTLRMNNCFCGVDS